MAEENPAAQRQTVVTTYFSSKQLLLFALQGPNTMLHVWGTIPLLPVN